MNSGASQSDSRGMWRAGRDSQYMGQRERGTHLASRRGTTQGKVGKAAKQGQYCPGCGVDVQAAVRGFLEHFRASMCWLCRHGLLSTTCSLLAQGLHASACCQQAEGPNPACSAAATRPGCGRHGPQPAGPSRPPLLPLACRRTHVAQLPAVQRAGSKIGALSDAHAARASTKPSRLLSSAPRRRLSPCRPGSGRPSADPITPHRSSTRTGGPSCKVPSTSTRCLQARTWRPPMAATKEVMRTRGTHASSQGASILSEELGSGCLPLRPVCLGF